MTNEVVAHPQVEQADVPEQAASPDDAARPAEAKSAEAESVAAKPAAGPCDEVIEELRLALVEIAHLREALQSNRDIGAATGILMALRGLTQPLAFDELRRSSQHTHRKLRDVAAEVLRTGSLPTAS